MLRLLIILSFVSTPAAYAQQDLIAEESDVTLTQARSLSFTVDDLVYDCRKCSEDEKLDECIFCNGVLTGAATVLGMFEIGKSFCPPDNIDTKMVRNFFRRWVLREGKANPEVNSYQAVQGVVMAMQSKFPCQIDEGVNQ